MTISSLNKIKEPIFSPCQTKKSAYEADFGFFEMFLLRYAFISLKPKPTFWINQKKKK